MVLLGDRNFAAADLIGEIAIADATIGTDVDPDRRRRTSPAW